MALYYYRHDRALTTLYEIGFQVSQLLIVRNSSALAMALEYKQYSRA